MSNINNETCFNSKRYKGFIIDVNLNRDFNTLYFSVINPYVEVVRNGRACNVHVHASKESIAKRIVDCYYARNKTRFGRNIRNKALSLEGTEVRF